MFLDELCNYCLQKRGVTQSFPFDQKTLVLKVGNKMFLLCDVENFTSLNLKCDPERSIELREQFTAIQPGYHMNKTHWNTVSLHMDVSDQFLLELVDHSYDLIFKSLPKKIQHELTN